MLSPGAVLSERYRLTEHLATGGMGEVWRGVDTVLGRTVAVKVLLPALLAEPGFAARFEAEARMMAALQHPGIVNVFDYGESDLPNGARAVYLVMEHVHGDSLAARLKQDGRLDLATTMSVVAQAAEALHAAHLAGIVHRDVKPGNLLMQDDGTVMLVDFGVARSVAAAAITGTNNVVGTALYMAPEQAAGRPVSPATDIYALGAVAYHCLAGYPPFAGGNPLEVAVKHLHEDVPPLPADIAAPIATLVARTLAKDPADRFTTAEDLALAARATLGEPVDATATSPALAGAAAPSAAPTAPHAATLSSPAAGASATAARPAPARRRRPLAALSAAGVVVAAALAGALALAPEVGTTSNDGGPGSGSTQQDQRGPAPAVPGSGGVGSGQDSSGTLKPGAPGGPARTAAPGSAVPAGPKGSASPDASATASSPDSTATPGRTGRSSAPAGGQVSRPPSPSESTTSAPASPSPEETTQSPEPEPTPTPPAAGGGGGGATPPPAESSPPVAGTGAAVLAR